MGATDKPTGRAFPAHLFPAWSFSEGLACVKVLGQKTSYINIHREVVFSVDGLDWADPFSAGLANAVLRIAQGQCIWGYIDHTGNFST
jgi:hypothetical protein